MAAGRGRRSPVAPIIARSVRRGAVQPRRQSWKDPATGVVFPAGPTPGSMAVVFMAAAVSAVGTAVAGATVEEEMG